jgi:hypothetical protein
MDDDNQITLTKAERHTMWQCLQWNSGFHASAKMMVLRSHGRSRKRIHPYQRTSHTHTHIKGAVDLANGWTANSLYRHIATRISFLRELREEHIINVYWITNNLMTSNIFTKNVGGRDFERHRDLYVRSYPSTSIQADSSTN